MRRQNKKDITNTANERLPIKLSELQQRALGLPDHLANDGETHRSDDA